MQDPPADRTVVDDMRWLIAASLLVLTQTVPATPIAVSLKARAVQPGEVVALTITTARPATALHVRAFDTDAQPYRIDAGTWRVLIGIDLEAAPKSYAVSIAADSPAGTAQTIFTLAVKPKVFDTRTLTVDDAFVNPPASVTKRIEDEAVLLTNLWKRVTPERLWTTPFVRPVPQPANSAFGKRSVFNG